MPHSPSNRLTPHLIFFLLIQGTSPGKTNKYLQNVNEKFERNINLNLINKLSSSEESNNKNMKTVEVCQGCQKPIKDRYLLNSLGRSWHEDCLKCTCCEARLGEVGASLYTRANLILCKRDYLRLFGNTGHCSACNKVIPAFEMVMRAKHNVYHLECFACQLCGHRSVSIPRKKKLKKGNNESFDVRNVF